MKTRYLALGLLHLAAGAPLLLAALGKRTPDVLPPIRRQAAVDTATKLTKPAVPAPLPENLKNPFNPPEFDRPDPVPSTPGGARPGQGPGGAQVAGPAAPAGPATDREIIEALAAKIPSAATMTLRGKTLLVLPNKIQLEAGARFTVAYNGQDYELELTTVNSTTFTLRYRNEEFTRPIRTR